MPTPHKHAALIKQWANDPTQNVWFWRNSSDPADWVKCNPTPLWYEDKHYALGDKPTAPPRRMCVLAGVEFPAPETEAPDKVSCFYSPYLTGTAYGSGRWRGDDQDMIALRNGLIHRTREAAEAHSRALLAANKAAIEGGKVMKAKFYVLIDCETVKPLEAQTYEEAFEEIDNLQGHTWVLDAEALDRLCDNIKEVRA